MFDQKTLVRSRAYTTKCGNSKSKESMYSFEDKMEHNSKENDCVTPSQSILTKVTTLMTEDNDFLELLRKYFDTDDIVEAFGKTLSVKDFVMSGIASEGYSAAPVLSVIWHRVCMKPMKGEEPCKYILSLLDKKMMDDDTYFLWQIWDTSITRHLYSKDGKERLSLRYIPPVKHEHKKTDLDVFLSPEQNLFTRYRIGAEAISQRRIYTNDKNYRETENHCSLIMNLLLEYDDDSILLTCLSKLSKASQEQCAIYICEKIAQTLFQLYRNNTKHIIFGSASKKENETNWEERRGFDKLFSVDAYNFWDSLSKGILPSYIVHIVSLIIMKDFTKNFATGKCQSFDHMTIWDKWTSLGLFTKANCIYQRIQKLERKECMECSERFDEYDHTFSKDKKNQLFIFSTVLNALNPEIKIPIYSCCSKCCNEKDLIFIGDNFFQSIIPSATIINKDNKPIVLYLFRVLRFLKGTAVLVKRDVFSCSKRKDCSDLGESLTEVYLTEDSYLDKMRPFKEITQYHCLEDLRDEDSNCSFRPSLEYDMNHMTERHPIRRNRFSYEKRKSTSPREDVFQDFPYKKRLTYYDNGERAQRHPSHFKRRKRLSPEEAHQLNLSQYEKIYGISPLSSSEEEEEGTDDIYGTESYHSSPRHYYDESESIDILGESM